jgi:hypothetical protein
MKSHVVGRVDTLLPTGRMITFDDVYYAPTSRVSLLSASSLTSQGWNVNVRKGGGCIRRGRDRLTLKQEACLWTAMPGKVSPWYS